MLLTRAYLPWNLVSTIPYASSSHVVKQRKKQKRRDIVPEKEEHESLPQGTSLSYYFHEPLPHWTTSSKVLSWRPCPRIHQRELRSSRSSTYSQHHEPLSLKAPLPRPPPQAWPPRATLSATSQAAQSLTHEPQDLVVPHPPSEPHYIARQPHDTSCASPTLRYPTWYPIHWRP